MKISNPVLTGFHADPSMIRVGDTYYIANSTFEWFPGVQLHESKDMVHWNPLPAALNTTELLDMRGNSASGGIWAPDLSYADGKFWLIYTDVKVVNGAFKDCTNYLATTEDIHGPWSGPIRVNGVGFDASLFHDDDGRKYLVQQTWDHREYKHAFHGITLTEFDIETMQLKPETARTIWMGDDVKLVEGPHLYKINGWYYLFAAEGGTVWTHQEVVARSRTLDELSFEASPTNPFITNFDTPRSYLQKQGHGALVDTPSGEWYYASLCGRPWHHETESFTDPRGWCTLGRETAIQKVEWDEARRVRVRYARPALEYAACAVRREDGFGRWRQPEADRTGVAVQHLRPVAGGPSLAGVRLRRRDLCDVRSEDLPGDGRSDELLQRPALVLGVRHVRRGPQVPRDRGGAERPQQLHLVPA